MCSIVPLLFVVLGTAVAAPQSLPYPLNEYAGKRVPVLYEAYYPEPREWNPEASLQKLRELTSQLVREEEQLSSQIASGAGLENVFEPRSQLLEYVFSRPAAAPAPAPAPAPLVLAGSGNSNSDDDVQVSSLTVSESAPADGHRIRHHHGQANWLLRRLANTPQNPDAAAPTTRR
ncbi:uncharacterized protein LOC100679146 [Nasonia vitripennis]|uniref:Uncharacterized protein n=1 Tax=Nasonia vitripennis TaxID=7425 RepID=A0A7M7GE79_NASVI|nr:uncharacterized protein LOC100679146 [Nasonia vitripennis]